MERLPIAGLGVFLAVAEHGSLRRAAAALGVRPPAVSYQLKALEERIGTVLFARTTRSLRLTDAGRALLERAAPAVAELGAALEEARSTAREARGALRITMPYVAFEMAIAGRLAAFKARHPGIELELSFSEAFIDIVAQGFHAGVRLGDHIAGDMVAVRLTPPVRQAVFAAPTYFAARGRPRVPRDLLEHDCIRYRYIASGRLAEWRFEGEEGVVNVDVGGTLIVDSTEALLRAAREGAGIAWLFRPSIEADLRAGLLECVLDDCALERPGYFLYFPRANTRLQAFRLFVDFMKA